jgi:hypothetical protein
LKQKRETGAVLVVSLIMLTIITLVVTSAYNMSTTNLQSVGNMQFRNEALTSANLAIDQVLSSPFTDSPTAEDINIDIDNSGTTDYIVNISLPTCMEITQASTPALSSLSLPTMSGSASWDSVWEIEATVTDANSGVAVQIRSGVKVRLSQAEKDAVCA